MGPFFRIIAKITRGTTDYVQDPMRKVWFEVLGNLDALDLATSRENPELRLGLKQWREFGEYLEFKEDSMMADAATRRRVNTGGLTGCSWLRCPLNGCSDLPLSREMLRCCRCRKVRAFGAPYGCSDKSCSPKAQYCTLACQRR